MMLTFRVVLPVAAALVLSSCAMPELDADAETRAVIGELVVPGEVDLPAGADLMVTFTGLQGEVLAEDRRRIQDGEPPYAFHLLVPSDRIGTVAGRVQAGGRTTWRSVSVLLDEGPHSARLGALALEPVEAEFTPAAGRAGIPEQGRAERRRAQVPGPAAPAEEMSEGPAAGAVETPMSAEGAGAGAPEAPAPSGPVRLSCGESQIRVSEADGAAELAVGETVVEMEATESGGSGRRYAVPGDPATYLALDGDGAEVSLAGAVFPDCTIVRREE